MPTNLPTNSSELLASFRWTIQDILWVYREGGDDNEAVHQDIRTGEVVFRDAGWRLLINLTPGRPIKFFLQRGDELVELLSTDAQVVAMNGEAAGSGGPPRMMHHGRFNLTQANGTTLSVDLVKRGLGDRQGNTQWYNLSRLLKATKTRMNTMQGSRLKVEKQLKATRKEKAKARNRKV